MTAEWVISCGCGRCWCQRFATEISPVCEECELGNHMAMPEDAAPRVGAAPARKCKRHEWITVITDGIVVKKCGRCGHPQDAAKVRAGRSARRLGGDQERRIERVYGPVKIGERGDPVDHLGAMFKYQSKASRRKAPPLFSGAIGRMDPLYGDRIPVLVLSFVKAGVPVDDYFVIRGRDWLLLHGRDEPGGRE